MNQLRGKALWAALATLVDGEGAIFIVGADYTTKVQIGNVCREWMEAWHARVGRGIIVPGEKPAGCKQVFRWVIQRKADVVFILKRILPYLFVKRVQAQLAIDFIEKKGIYYPKPGGTRSGKRIPAQELAWREECRQRMRKLNSKGNPERLYVEHPPQVDGDIVRALEPSRELSDNDLAL